jgi:hypothetical protein
MTDTRGHLTTGNSTSRNPRVHYGEGTGEWLLKEDNFQRAGAGKTVLASVVINRLGFESE